MNMKMEMGPAPASGGNPVRLLRSSLKRTWQNFRYGMNRNLLRNPSARKQFSSQPPQLSPVQQRVVNDLKANGIARAKLADVFGAATAAEQAELVRMAEAFAASDPVRTAEEKLRSGESRGVAKEFLVKKYKANDRRVPSDPLFQFALRPELLDIVNSYAGLWTRLYDVEMLYNMPSGKPLPRTQSQNWHRDFTDVPTIKVFLYYRDVDDEAGPLEYIPGSRVGGKYAYLWPQPGWILKQGYYPSAEKVDQAVPPTDREKCCVPALTLVFCDTSGFHRGGYAVGKPRLASVWTYLTPASLATRMFEYEPGKWIDQLSPPAKFALG